MPSYCKDCGYALTHAINGTTYWYCCLHMRDGHHQPRGGLVWERAKPGQLNRSLYDDHHCERFDNMSAPALMVSGD